MDMAYTIYTVMAFIVMAYKVMAYIFMVNEVMAYVVVAFIAPLYNYGLHSYGLYGYGPYSYTVRRDARYLSLVISLSKLFISCTCSSLRFFASASLGAQ